MDKTDLKNIGYLFNTTLGFGSYYELFPQLLFRQTPFPQPEDFKIAKQIHTQSFTSEELLGADEASQLDTETNLVTRIPKFYYNTVVFAEQQREAASPIKAAECIIVCIAEENTAAKAPVTVLIPQTEKDNLEETARKAAAEAEALRQEVERLKAENSVLLTQRDPLFEEREKEAARVRAEEAERARKEQERLEELRRQREEEERRRVEELAREKRELEERVRREELERYYREQR